MAESCRTVGALPGSPRSRSQMPVEAAQGAANHGGSARRGGTISAAITVGRVRTISRASSGVMPGVRSSCDRASNIPCSGGRLLGRRVQSRPLFHNHSPRRSTCFSTTARRPIRIGLAMPSSTTVCTACPERAPPRLPHRRRAWDRAGRVEDRLHHQAGAEDELLQNRSR